MEKLLFLFSIFLAACAQLQTGQLQPVMIKDVSKNIWVTNCGGSVETWGSCYDKARSTCKNAYTVINQVETSTGTKRELTFQCKK